MKGRVFKYGDSVNTDVIFPGKYTYTITDPAEMAPHAMEGIDPEFPKKVKPGDVIVAGRNFGCGSSREQASKCLKALGVAAIIAKSYSRIYFRSGINNGILLVTCADAVDALEDGDEVSLDLSSCTITAKGQTWQFPPIPPSVLEILTDGGLIPHIRKKIGK